MEQDEAGRGIEISGDGSTLAVGFPGNGNGFVRLYKFNNENKQWDPKGDPIFGPQAQSGFGLAISLSEDGDTILVGSPFYSSPEKSRSGQVSVYQFDQIKNGWFLYGNAVDGEDPNCLFGTSVDFVPDGTQFVVGAPGCVSNRGTVQAFILGQAVNGQHYWDTYGSIMRGQTEGDRFGHDVSTTKDAELLTISSPLADSVNGESGVGKVLQYFWDASGYYFVLDDTEGPRPESRFGNSIALSPSGRTFVAAEEVKSSFPNKNTGSVRVYSRDENFYWALTGDFIGLPLGPVETYVNKGPSIALSGEETSSLLARYLAIGYESVEFDDITLPPSGLVRVYEWRGIRL
jgi:hypothetical protein